MAQNLQASTLSFVSSLPATRTLPNTSSLRRDSIYSDSRYKGFLGRHLLLTTAIEATALPSKTVMSSTRETASETVDKTETQKFYSRQNGKKIAKDVVVFIHGITIENEPGKNVTQGQLASYNALYEGVKNMMKGSSNEKSEEWEKAETIRVLWGYEGMRADGKPLSGLHTKLAQAQRFLGTTTDQIEKDHQTFGLNPLKWLIRSARSPLRYGMSDMFFYVSAAGRPLIRQAVATQIMTQGINELIDKGEPIELTLLGHSAGSVVAHDFAFFLHNAQNMTIQQTKEESEKFAAGDAELRVELQKLIDHAQKGKLKIRKLFTFGSPLHILFIRSLPVLERFTDESAKRVDPAAYGLCEDYEGATYPRWINTVEEGDPIAGPVCGLVEPTSKQTGSKTIVKDEFLNLTWKTSEAHSAYWRSTKFSEVICKHW